MRVIGSGLRTASLWTLGPAASPCRRGGWPREISGAPRRSIYRWLSCPLTQHLGRSGWSRGSGSGPSALSSPRGCLVAYPRRSKLLLIVLWSCL